MRKIEEIVQIFKVLGDEHRLRILLMLKKRPMYVCRIQEVLDIALSTVSQQLKLMSISGYILKTREGRWIAYRINDENELLMKLLDIVEKGLERSAVIRRDEMKARECSSKC